MLLAVAKNNVTVVYALSQTSNPSTKKEQQQKNTNLKNEGKNSNAKQSPRFRRHHTRRARTKFPEKNRAAPRMIFTAPVSIGTYAPTTHTHAHTHNAGRRRHVVVYLKPSVVWLSCLCTAGPPAQISSTGTTSSSRGLSVSPYSQQQKTKHTLVLLHHDCYYYCLLLCMLLAQRTILKLCSFSLLASLFIFQEILLGMMRATTVSSHRHRHGHGVCRLPRISFYSTH